MACPWWQSDEWVGRGGVRSREAGAVSDQGRDGNPVNRGQGQDRVKTGEEKGGTN